MKKKLKILGIVILVLSALYCFLVFTNIGFIAKYRTLYIETAMSTMNHKWMATAFIPQSVIDKALEEQRRVMEINIESSIITENIARDIIIRQPNPGGDISLLKEVPEDKIKEKFPYLSVEAAKKVYYSDLEVFDESHELYTESGDLVYALDLINDVGIVNFEGPNYKGRLAIANDSSQVILAATDRRDRGEMVVDFEKKNNGIIAVNGGGFKDPEWMGSGADPVGLVVSRGEKRLNKLNNNWVTCGFTDDDEFIFGTKIDDELYRDAVQFTPAIILNGEKVVDGSAGWGINPHTIVGQTWDMRATLLVVDGRRVGHSIGATLGECADVLLKYNVKNAVQMDGGSSSVMSYNSQTITKPSTSYKDGRYVPNAWVILRKDTDLEKAS